MGKALLAVGAFLTCCFLVFGGVVYFTRKEDRIAVDSLLAERISKAFVDSEQRRQPLDLRTLTPFDWDRVLIYVPGTPRAAVSRQLGFPFKGDLPYTAESSEVFVFTNRGAFVRFADYRGRGRFAGLRRPFESLTANDAVFDIKDATARLSR
ncbi:MAG: hypothetical protein QOE86_2155 [Solirubrobacteraceae bacterium]|jgi:hypothetical protein|nr:hypothetical protein [Solirubrobacteraceae bacterium]